MNVIELETDEVRPFAEKVFNETFREYYSYLRKIANNKKLITRNKTYLRTQFYFQAMGVAVEGLVNGNYVLRENLVRGTVQDVFYLPTITAAMLSGDLNYLQNMKGWRKRHNEIYSELKLTARVRVEVKQFLGKNYPGYLETLFHLLPKDIKAMCRRHLRGMKSELFGGHFKRENIIKEIFSRKPKPSEEEEELSEFIVHLPKCPF